MLIPAIQRLKQGGTLKGQFQPGLHKDPVSNKTKTQKKQGVDLEFYVYLWFGFYLISENSVIMFFDEDILE